MKTFRILSRNIDAIYDLETSDAAYNWITQFNTTLPNGVVFSLGSSTPKRLVFHGSEERTGAKGQPIKPAKTRFGVSVHPYSDKITMRISGGDFLVQVAIARKLQDILTTEAPPHDSPQK